MKENNTIWDHLRKRPVETPDARYFEALTTSILQEQKPKVVPIYRRTIVQIVTAAVAASIAIFIYFRPAPEPPAENVLLALQDIPHEDVLAYVHTHIDEFDIDMLAAAIPSENIETVEIAPASEETVIEIPSDAKADINFENIDNQDILEYLESEEVDLYELDI